MAINVTRNILEGTFADEEFGELVYAEEMVLVRDVTGDVLAAALENTGVPQPGAAWDVDNPTLKCVRRQPRYVGRDEKGSKVQIKIIYELQRSDPIPMRGGASVTNVTSQVDSYGDRVVVEHNGDKQGGEFNAMEAVRHAEIPLAITTNDPDSEVGLWINTVNEDKWRDLDPGQWLCSRVDYSPLDLSSDPRVYQFTFEFDGKRRDTWDPVVVYFDHDQGKIPADLVKGKGIVDVIWYDGQIYSDQFPAT